MTERKMIGSKKMIDPKIIQIASKIEDLKFTGVITEFSKFCEGYNEAIDRVLELIINEIQEDMF